MDVSAREKLLSGVVAFVTVLAVAAVSITMLGMREGMYMVASVGAATVLIAAVPGSPLSQPWPLLGGHLLSATVGVTMCLYVPQVWLAAALAVSLSIIIMYFTYCLHPPGGAVALAAVLAQDSVREMGYAFVLAPVAVNVMIMLVSALVLNNLLPSRRYPAMLSGSRSDGLTLLANNSLLHSEDFVSAMQEKDSFVDVSREELEEIYQLAVLHANKRRLGQVLCADIMSGEVLCFQYGDLLNDAWQVLASNKLKAAPVVDKFGHVIGMVTIKDMVTHALDLPGRDMLSRIRRLISRTDGHYSDKPETVGQIMSAPAITTDIDRHIVDLIPTFTHHSIHHLPVLDHDGRLAGMVTRSDLLRALLLTRL